MGAGARAVAVVAAIVGWVVGFVVAGLAVFFLVPGGTGAIIDDPFRFSSRSTATEAARGLLQGVPGTTLVEVDTDSVVVREVLFGMEWLYAGANKMGDEWVLYGPNSGSGQGVAFAIVGCVVASISYLIVWRVARRRSRSREQDAVSPAVRPVA